MSFLHGNVELRAPAARQRGTSWYQRQKDRVKNAGESVTLLRLTGWLMFGVAGSLLPLAIDLTLGIKDYPRPTIFEVLAHGELFIIITVLTAGGLGELFFALAGTGSNSLAKLLALGGCIWVMLLTLILYIGTAKGPSTPNDISRIGWQSIGMFISGLITTGSCIYIAAESR